MNDFEHDDILDNILECVRRKISDDVLESIVSAQKMYHCSNDSSSQKKGLSDQVNRKPGTKSAATMTEKEPTPVISASTSASNRENGKVKAGWRSGDGQSRDKKIGKKQTAAERQAAKKRLAEEKREMQMANKIYKPGECMKHMTVEVHPALSSAWYAADIAREVNAAGAKVRISSALCSPALVLWSRATLPALSTEGGVLELAPTQQKCSRALYIATAEEVSEFVTAKNLSQHIDNMKQLTACDVTLVLFGVEEYFKPSGRKRSNHRQQMTEIQLEMALTDLLVTASCDTVKVDSPNELALTITHFTKAIAEAPYKQAKRQFDEQAQFYMRGDNKNCVAVTKTGAGLSQLWQQMLAVLPMSSLERSRALCAKYNSPRQLYEELLTPSGVATIADIGVPRSAVPGSVARRTGGEFARKLAILFTADDGDALVQ